MVRESISKNQTFGIVGATVLLLIAACLIGRQMLAGRSQPWWRQAFYSDDDGKTWFVDTANKTSPFDHNGKPAYRVAVFRRDGKELFVAYLMKSSDVKAPVPAALANDPQAADPKFQPTIPMDIKRPGENRWLSVNGGVRAARDGPLTGQAAADMAAYNKLMYPTIPAGSSLQAVTPNDPDNGAQPR